MKKRLFTQIILLAATTIVFAQSTLTGRITDARTGEPLIGASVIVKSEKGKGVVTDIDGNFTLQTNVEAPLTLKAEYVGYRPLDVDVYDFDEPVEIKLIDNSNLLQTVVVLGYTQVKRQNLTGAVTSVKAADIASTAASGFNEQLQGQAPGVIISGSSGTPGSGVFVRLRGTTSINAGNEPLYIIDGVPVNSQPLQSIANGGQTINALADLNPNDIEKIEVLKDANATAIYGARGANGVVLVTTKRGDKGQKTRVTFNAEYGFAKAAKLWDLATGPETAQILNEAWINDGKDPSLVPYRSKESGGLGLPEEQQTYNRQSVVFRTANIQNYNLGIAGGSDRTRFYVGAEYTDQEAIVRTQGFRRLGFRVNLDHDINRSVTLTTGTSLQWTRRSLSRIANSPKGILQASVHHSTLLSPYNEDGSYARYGIFDNIYALIDNSNHHTYGLRSLDNVALTWRIRKGLQFKSAVSLDYNNYREKRYFNTQLADGQPNGSAEDATTTNYTVSAEQLLNYNVDLGKIHSLAAFLGNSVQYTGLRRQSIKGSGFPDDALQELASAAITTGTTSFSSYSLVSWFGGANYSLLNRYAIDANLRADASSRFGKNHRWGLFPSIGASWTVSEESWLKPVKFIDGLKLKASIGWSGNQNIDDFASLGLWNGGGVYNDESGVLHTQLANPDLKWETTRQWNIGLEGSLLNGRITFELDYYNKYTYDLLLSTPIAGKTGFSSTYSNLGEMSNKGVELLVTTKNIQKKDFTWETAFNIAHNENRIERLPVAFSQYDRDWVRLEEGKPMYSFWLYKQLYVDPETGNAVYDDVNDDKKITVADRQIVGDAWPDVTGGLRNTFQVKNFDLSMFFYFSLGNDVFNMNRFFQEHGGMRGTNWGLLKSQMDRWQKPGDITDIPRASTLANADGSSNNGFASSRFLEDGSFLRLRNVSLGYTLPKSLVAKAGIEKLRVYVNATNLFTITGYSGADPEGNTAADYTHGTVQGLDFAIPPQPRQVVFGASLTL
jgi:TonB-linked SusC/RagA family outer membrane protein